MIHNKYAIYENILRNTEARLNPKYDGKFPMQREYITRNNSKFSMKDKFAYNLKVHP